MRRKKSVIPGFGLSFGIVMAILGIIVIIPLCSLVFFSLKLSPHDFLVTVTRPRVLASYKVSILTALTASLINAVMGMIIAWVLGEVCFSWQKDYGWNYRDAFWHCLQPLRVLHFTHLTIS